MNHIVEFAVCTLENTPLQSIYSSFRWWINSIVLQFSSNTYNFDRLIKYLNVLSRWKWNLQG